MALFERENLDSGSDVASRALSVTAVENDFVERVYDKIAKVYDLTFGPTLHPGRLIALERMGIKDYQITINQTINPSAGMSEEQLAKKTNDQARKALQQELRNANASHGGR